MKYLWMLVFITVFIWSGISPKDQFTWFLEVFPALFGAILALIILPKFHNNQLKNLTRD